MLFHALSCGMCSVHLCMYKCKKTIGTSSCLCCVTKMKLYKIANLMVIYLTHYCIKIPFLICHTLNNLCFMGAFIFVMLIDCVLVMIIYIQCSLYRIRVYKQPFITWHSYHPLYKPIYYTILVYPVLLKVCTEFILCM